MEKRGIGAGQLVRLWDAHSPKLLATLCGSTNEADPSWIAWTREGHYGGSRGAEEKSLLEE